MKRSVNSKLRSQGFLETAQLKITKGFVLLKPVDNELAIHVSMEPKGVLRHCGSISSVSGRIKMNYREIPL